MSAASSTASFSTFWRWYQGMLRQHPLATKAITSCLLMSCSDVACQSLERQKHSMLLEWGSQSRARPVNLLEGCPVNRKAPLPASQEHLVRYDPWRTFQVGLTGLIFSGPISHGWYNVLERVVRIRHKWASLGTKMLLDAMVFSPIAVGGYFTIRGILEGRTWQGIWDKLQLKWKGALLASWSFWPAANVINFSLVPLPFRVLYNNSLSLFWNAYLSNVNNQRLEQVVTLQQMVDEDEDANPSDPDDESCVCSHCRCIRA